MFVVDILYILTAVVMSLVVCGEYFNGESELRRLYVTALVPPSAGERVGAMIRCSYFRSLGMNRETPSRPFRQQQGAVLQTSKRHL